MLYALLYHSEKAVAIAMMLDALYTWTHQRKIPHFKVGRSVRFDKTEIDMWLEARKISAVAISESRVPPVKKELFA